MSIVKERDICLNLIPTMCMVDCVSGVVEQEWCMRPPKSKVIELLKRRGLEMRRVTVKGKRMWAVSDRKMYSSLAKIWQAYK